jgi:hypothetical protein
MHIFKDFKDRQFAKNYLGLVIVMSVKKTNKQTKKQKKKGQALYFLHHINHVV